MNTLGKRLKFALKDKGCGLSPKKPAVKIADFFIKLNQQGQYHGNQK